jgi:hypothetical protein
LIVFAGAGIDRPTGRRLSSGIAVAAIVPVMRIQSLFAVVAKPMRWWCESIFSHIPTARPSVVKSSAVEPRPVPSP